MKVCDVLPSLRLPGSKSSGTLLMESICQSDLKRPLHFNDLLLPAILKWADWHEDYRKDNQLVFGHHPAIDQLCLNDKVNEDEFIH